MNSKKLILLNVDFLKHANVLDIRELNGKKFVFDPIRKKLIILQPEELVRQLILSYFICENLFPKSRMAVERAIYVENALKRFDLVLFDKLARPWMLVECKTFNNKIEHNAVLQACQYNYALKAPYLMVSNGKNTICCSVDYENRNVVYLDEMPVS